MTDLPAHHARSIESLRAVPGGVEILCDCATLTELQLQIDPDAPAQEIPFLCDGCNTVTWFTFTPKPDPKDQM